MTIDPPYIGLGPLPELGTAYDNEEVYQLMLWPWEQLVELETVKPLDQYDLLLTEERRKALINMMPPKRKVPKG